MIDKKELISVISKRAKINLAQAESAVNDVIVELVSPQLFAEPGEEVGFINDNHCHNNCKEEFARKIR